MRFKKPIEGDDDGRRAAISGTCGIMIALPPHTMSLRQRMSSSDFSGHHTFVLNSGPLRSELSCLMMSRKSAQRVNGVEVTKASLTISTSLSSDLFPFTLDLHGTSEGLNEYRYALFSFAHTHSLKKALPD